MDFELPAWVVSAVKLPIAFAQVREDAELDSWIVAQIGGRARVMMVASGGCTAAALAAGKHVDWLHLIDPNPAQIALTRLKLRLLQRAGIDERLALLGHRSQPPAERATRLAGELAALELPADVLGPPELVAELGPDHAGKYERVFAELRGAMSDQLAELQYLLTLSGLAEQQRRAAPQNDLGRRLDESLDQVMALPNLVGLFGDEATRNPVMAFSKHFAARIRHVLSTLPAAENPYLWQMLLGRFPPDVVSPWLSAPVPANLPRITWVTQFMDEALRAVPAPFDVVHLSNILDWLTPEKAQRTLALSASALRRGGLVVVRQLNSTLDIPALGPQFKWLDEMASTLHGRDRSFFYRAIHLGRKR